MRRKGRAQPRGSAARRAEYAGAGLESCGRAAVAGTALCGHGLGLASAKRQATGPAESPGICDHAGAAIGGQVERAEGFPEAAGIRWYTRPLAPGEGRYALPRLADGSGGTLTPADTSDGRE